MAESQSIDIDFQEQELGQLYKDPSTVYYQNQDTSKGSRAAVLSYILESEQRFDTLLCCADGRLGAHRILLSFASPFLKMLLQDETQKPGELAVVILPDIRMPVMKIILNLLYTGSMVYPRELEFELYESMMALGVGESMSVKITEVKTQNNPEAPQEARSNIFQEPSRFSQSPTNRVSDSRQIPDLEESDNESIPTAVHQQNRRQDVLNPPDTSSEAANVASSSQSEKCGTGTSSQLDMSQNTTQKRNRNSDSATDLTETSSTSKRVRLSEDYDSSNKCKLQVQEAGRDLKPDIDFSRLKPCVQKFSSYKRAADKHNDESVAVFIDVDDLNPVVVRLDYEPDFIVNVLRNGCCMSVEDPSEPEINQDNVDDNDSIISIHSSEHDSAKVNIAEPQTSSEGSQ